MDTARVLGGKSLRIPVLLSYNGIAVKVNALLDSGADGYLYLNRSIAPKVRAAIGAPQDQLTRAADLKGYRTDDSDKVTTVLQAHLTIDGIKLLNEPFVEADLGNNEVIIGLLVRRTPRPYRLREPRPLLDRWQTDHCAFCQGHRHGH